MAKPRISPVPALPKWAAAVLSLVCGVGGALTLCAIAGLPLPFTGVAVASTGAGTGTGGALSQLTVTIAGVWIAWVSYSLFALHVSMATMSEALTGLRADVAGLKTDVAGLQTAMVGLTTATGKLTRRR